jgi:hypothetical protein
MAQRKETKKNLKIRDLTPKKDAKGGGAHVFGQRQQTSGHGVTSPGGGHGVTSPGGGHGPDLHI